MKNLVLFIFGVLTTFYASAQQHVLSGTITDHKNGPVPFASVYIRNTTYGSTANENGDYLFKLNPGTYNVVYRFVGYKEKVEKITIVNQDVINNVRLEDDEFKLKKVKSKEKNPSDPAIEIMHQVINKREYYLNEIKSYSCIEYVKGVKTIVSSPKTLLAKGIAKVLNLDTSGRGISYQSESLSTYSFEQPDKVKEVFIASKTAGSNPPFGYNKASDLQVNFYKDLFYIEGLSSHGFVSPVSSRAFRYYNYKLLGTIVQDGEIIDKIQVIPKYLKAVGFSGTIYIIEGDWRIYSVDLLLTKKENNLNFVDSLRVSQQYIPVGKTTWMPLSFQYNYVGSTQGFKYNGYYLGIINNYKIDTPFKDGYFTGEILHVDTEANIRSRAYWESTRPVPLTYPEERKFKTKDSIENLKGYTAYLDSLQRINNRFRPLHYVKDGYLVTNRTGSDSLYFLPLYQTVYYNTVEGWGVYLNALYSRTYPDNRSFSISPTLRYGFANNLFSANLHTSYTYDQEHAGRFFVNFGTDLLDLNSLQTRSLYFNTLSTLLSEQNFVKYYRSQYGEFGYQRELTNGILWRSNLNYAKRTQLYNVSYNHIFSYVDRHYTSNNPLAPLSAPANDRSALFPEHNALTFTTSLKFTFDQQYITRPTGKVYVPSPYPVVTVNYRKGVHGIFGSDVDYDFVSVDILQNRFPLGLFGYTSFKVTVGDFFNKKTLYFMDYNHFLGNEGTTIDPSNDGSFLFLPFYTFSTNAAFVEAHYQHNFAGVVFDNVPLLNRLKLEEIVGANYLGEKNNPNYYEFYVGIKRLVFGVDYVVSFLGNKKYLNGLKVYYGIK
ncbi:MAG TPA: DUF5686 and carboxypeptidase regulatory-like domain-containing protein [Mucilaginibacter sp.]|jgi:hypothetical protein|nr:DUF5686 and carboxypeptidase regulatory-like domain-containing protein [Mucilaginibacter sp.]